MANAPPPVACCLVDGPHSLKGSEEVGKSLNRYSARKMACTDVGRHLCLLPVHACQTCVKSMRYAFESALHQQPNMPTGTGIPYNRSGRDKCINRVASGERGKDQSDGCYSEYSRYAPVPLRKSHHTRAIGSSLNVPPGGPARGVRPAFWNYTAAPAWSLTSILPVFSPVKRPRKALGAFSSPSMMVSCHLILPAAIHAPMSA